MLTRRSWFLFGCGVGIVLILGGFCVMYAQVRATSENVETLGAAVTPEDLEPLPRGLITGIVTVGLGIALVATCGILMVGKRREDDFREELTSAGE